MSDITLILSQIEQGDPHAAEQLLPLIYEELRKLATAIGQGAQLEQKEEQRIELAAAQERCDVLASTLAAWMKQQAPESVYWVEVEGTSRRRVSLASAPLDVGPTLRRELFEQVPTCVLTSATLSVGAPPRFDFLKARVGLTACETLQLGSPFDYPSQVTIHLPRNLPDPSDRGEEFERRAIGAIPEVTVMAPVAAGVNVPLVAWSL